MLLTANGTRLNVIDEGTGPPVVFLHPLGGSWRYWEGQLDALSDRFRCIALDCRGFGSSDRPDEPFSFETLADDAEAVCAELGLGTVCVVGLSMGGMVAQHLAIRHPERVSALVLADTTCASDPALVDAVKGAVGMIESMGLAPFVEMGAQATWSAATTAEHPEVVRRFKREEGSTDPRVYAAAVEAVAMLDTTAALASVTAPALVVWGSLDGWMPIDHGHRLVEALPNARLHVIEGAGHLPSIERAADFNAALIEFLEAGG